jgi:AcrR family transcriptional regulator
MKQLESLPQDKSEKLVSVLISEFSAYGYRQASTNRIAGAAGISKGSLFNYLGSKQAQYFYILRLELNSFKTRLSELIQAQPLPADSFDRLLAITKLKLRIALENPVGYKLLIDAVNDPSPEIQAFFTSEFTIFAADSVLRNRELFDPKTMIHPELRDALSDIVFYIIAGYTTHFFKEQGNTLTDIETQFQRISDQLTACFNALRMSFLK